MINNFQPMIFPRRRWLRCFRPGAGALLLAVLATLNAQLSTARGLLQDKKLFPLLAVLKFENGPERLRFEVKTITLSKLTDADAKLFSPPDDCQEIRPLPF